MKFNDKLGCSTSTLYNTWKCQPLKQQHQGEKLGLWASFNVGIVCGSIEVDPTAMRANDKAFGHNNEFSDNSASFSFAVPFIHSVFTEDSKGSETSGLWSSLFFQ